MFDALSDPSVTGLEEGNSVICTTPTQDTPAAMARAQDISKWFQCPFVSRQNRSLRSVLNEAQARTLIVADRQPRLYSLEDLVHPLFFHPGMAQQRIIRMRRGEADRLLAAADIRMGDVVVDATFGLGTDSLVFAEAVGETGQVVGIESSLCLARLFTYAQAKVPMDYPLVHPLLDRIHLQLRTHADALAAMPENSVDVVYFDPMFRTAPKSDSNLDVARPWANPEPLSTQAWTHAQRVARRSVVLKERLGSGQFERFGLYPDKRTTRFAFGVWRKEQSNG